MSKPVQVLTASLEGETESVMQAFQACVLPSNSHAKPGPCFREALHAPPHEAQDHMKALLLALRCDADLQDGYGLGVQGFEVPELGPGIFWGHAGINPGFGSFALYGRETNITFALFLNNENMEPIRNLMLDAVVQVLNSTSVSS